VQLCPGCQIVWYCTRVCGTLRTTFCCRECFRRSCSIQWLQPATLSAASIVAVQGGTSKAASQAETRLTTTSVSACSL
jgi:hypothetical protein